MCGIAGALTPAKPKTAIRLTDRIISALGHRGPDGAGLVSAGSAALGMCRLRIRSRKDAKLPFALASGTRAAFNGEIYGLTDDVEPQVPGGGEEEASALCSNTWRDADGMYALAALAADGSVRLVRDRFGIKPLFLRSEGARTTFASELPALAKEGGRLRIDHQALHEIIALGRTLDRRTIFDGIRELDPGEELLLAPDGKVMQREIFRGQSLAGTQAARTSERSLRAAIQEALERTLVSNQQVGLALSGGVDSSILAHELKALGVRNLNTHSLVVSASDDGLVDLSKIGLGSCRTSATWMHSCTSINEKGYFSMLAKTARCIGEPFRMSSLPLYYELGAEARRRGSTVLLLGEGADEMFGGYESYAAFEPQNGNVLKAIADFYLAGAAAQYIRSLIGGEAAALLRRRLTKTIKPLIEGHKPRHALLTVERQFSLEPLLRRADHALMAASVEGRTPFLHGRVPQLASTMLENDLWCSRENKRALRRTYGDILPHNLAKRPKCALRAPKQLWREGGSAALSELATFAMPLLSALGLRESGLASVRRGCAAGDPAAIPLAVSIMSTVACLSKLALEERLDDPVLARAGVKAAHGLLASSFFGPNFDFTQALHPAI